LGVTKSEHQPGGGEVSKQIEQHVDAGGMGSGFRPETYRL
jgi:hypothetical protein